MKTSRYNRIANRAVGIVVLTAGLVSSKIQAQVPSCPSPVREDEAALVVSSKVRAVGHLVQSHTLGMLNRPFSAVEQGVFSVGVLAVDLARRADIRFRRMPCLGTHQVPAVSGASGMDLADWERDLDRITGRPAENGTLRYLVGGETFFTRLEQAVRNAKQSVHMQTYIYDNDDVALDLADLLRAQSMTLDVKILFDGLGTQIAQGVRPDSLPKEYVGPDSMRRYLESGSRVKVRATQNTWLRGDHVKCTIIDDERAFLGGMNIGREYRYDWHDLMVEIAGPAANVLQDQFDRTWKRSGVGGDLGRLLGRSPRRPEPKRNPGEYGLRFIATEPGSPILRRVHLEALRRARNYAIFENAYLADDAMILELCKARKRGVDVRVILPEASNHQVMQINHRLVERTLIRHGVRVYRYPGMSHVKAGVIDGWACLGTANLDKLSFYVNRELNVATSDPAAVDALLRDLLAKDLEKSTEVTQPRTVAFSDHVVELIADEL